MRDHRIHSVEQNYPKSLLRYKYCTAYLGGPCIYGTYVVLPIAVGGGGG